MFYNCSLILDASSLTPLCDKQPPKQHPEALPLASHCPHSHQEAPIWDVNWLGCSPLLGWNHSGRSTGHAELCFSNYSLINKLKNIINNVNQVWYADDASEAGTVSRLNEGWDLINIEGPKYGYFTKASKTWLVTKEDCFSITAAALADTNAKVTSECRSCLGAALATGEYIQAFVTGKV